MMTCAELRVRLESYARGVLPPAEAAALELHLSDCAACSAYLEQAEPPPSPERLGALPASVEPPADLWPAIHGRITRGGGLARRRVAVPGWLLAAAAVLLIVVSSGVTALWLRSRSAGPSVQAAGPVAPLEAQYAAATAELAEALEHARGRLAPGTIALIQRNLAVIDSALAESRRALAADPGNATLEGLVIAVWRQKMDFLRRAAALTGEG